MVSRGSAADDLRAALDGDAAAWEALIDDHGSLVWAVIRGAGLSGADADDVFQLTFVRLLERGDSIREPERLRGWLATTARNEATSVYRKRRRVELVDDLSGIVDPLDRELAAGVVVDETVGAVQRALGELGDRCRALLHLLFSDPAPTYEVISSILGIKIGSIGPTRQRCLDELRRSRFLRGTR